MNLNKGTKILIVGLGVIGGGYAKALSDKGYRVNCITLDEGDIEYAKSHGMIERGTTKIDERIIAESELIIFALYPTIFIEWIEKYQYLFTKGTIITDVTGVKSSVVYRIQDILRPDVEFISAHPMAGRESSGVRYSDPSVFRGANYIVVPTDQNTEGAIELCKQLGTELGFSRISELSPEEHDKMIAYLSQLTHCIAITLMNSNQSEGLEKYTGDSFRDLTRIAKINDKMWAELFMLNKDALIAEMDAFIEEFSLFRDLLQNGEVEKMRDKMRTSTERRSRFDKPIPKA